MRIRITHASPGEGGDGAVAPFEPSRIYDIRPMLAVYLIAIGSAERVDGIQTRPEDPPFLEFARRN